MNYFARRHHGWKILFSCWLRVAALTFLFAGRGSAQSTPAFPSEFFQFPPGFETYYGSGPVAFTTNLVSVEAEVAPYYGNVLILDTTNLTPAYLEYYVMDTNWNANIEYDFGSILFFFQPNWASVAQGGSGPGTTAYFISGGDWSSGSPNGLFRIYADASGSNVYFGGISGGTTNTYVSTPISWASNTWHEVGVEYSARTSRIYLDGALATTGSGVSIVPILGTNTNGFYTNTFYVGSDNSTIPFDPVVAVVPRRSSVNCGFGHPWYLCQ